LNLPASHLETGLIEKIFQSAVAPGIRNWFLSGGEPLCHPHLDEVLTLFRQFGHRPKIATNGILLVPEIIDRWVSLGVQSVQFSLDTLKPTLFKNLSGGSPKNHQAILENMKYAVDSPLRVVASSVLTKDNAGCNRKWDSL
jgi:molybdenum cofactor biosynthesis enzyme MoaA